jgi:hypothetical protein
MKSWNLNTENKISFWVTGDGVGSRNSLKKLLTAGDGYLLAGMGLIGIGGGR